MIAPKDNGPLSRHLSRKQTESIHANWDEVAESTVLTEFLGCVGAKGKAGEHALPASGTLTP